MEWRDKLPKSADANIRQKGAFWEVRVKLTLPDNSPFEREHRASTKTAAKKIRDDVYAAYNTRAYEIFADFERAQLPPERPRLTLEELTEKCLQEWWPARGRSADIAEQYAQKLRTYCIPVLGAEKPIDQITPDDWDLILKGLTAVTSQFKRPLSESTIRKTKACLSSALSCAVSQKCLAVNPLKGLPYNPKPLAEAERLGLDVGEVDDDEALAKRMLSNAESKIILEKAKGTLLYPMVVLQLGFGLRIAEALAVKWSDFDWDRRELRVRYQVKRRRNVAWTKGGKEAKSKLERVKFLKSKAGARNIYLFDDSLSLVNTLQVGSGDALVCPNERGGLMEPRNAQRLFSEILGAAKLAAPKPTTHSMRSWRLSHWANVLTLPASQLQRLAGHTRVETTLRFYVRGDTGSLKQWLSSRAEPTSLFADSVLLLHAQGERGQPAQSE